MSVDLELKSLVALFDDTDETVVTAVNERMLGRGISVLRDLSYIYDTVSSHKQKECIAERMRYLSTEFVLSELDKLAATEYPDLVRGVFLISKLVTPDLEEEYFEDLVQVLLDDLRKEINDDKTAPEKVEIFNHIFYNRLLFKFRDYPMTRESTSIITSVLSSRHGTPFAVSLIYFMLARCAGVDIFPMCFEGGYVPAYIEGDKVLFYVDIFKNGEIFSEDKLRMYMEAQGIDVENNTFEVREDRVLLVIYLEGLSYMYSLKGDAYNTDLLNRGLEMFGEERFLERGEEEE